MSSHMQKIGIILPVTELRLLPRRQQKIPSGDTKVKRWRHFCDVATAISKYHTLPFRHMSFIFPHHRPSLQRRTRPTR
jgi:hypothetical protein